MFPATTLVGNRISQAASAFSSVSDISSNEDEEIDSSDCDTDNDSDHEHV